MSDWIVAETVAMLLCCALAAWLSRWRLLSGYCAVLALVATLAAVGVIPLTVRG